MIIVHLQGECYKQLQILLKIQLIPHKILLIKHQIAQAFNSTKQM